MVLNKTKFYIFQFYGVDIFQHYYQISPKIIDSHYTNSPYPVFQLRNSVSKYTHGKSH